MATRIAHGAGQAAGFEVEVEIEVEILNLNLNLSLFLLLTYRRNQGTFSFLLNDFAAPQFFKENIPGKNCDIINFSWIWIGADYN